MSLPHSLTLHTFMSGLEEEGERKKEKNTGVSRWFIKKNDGERKKKEKERMHTVHVCAQARWQPQPQPRRRPMWRESHLQVHVPRTRRRPRPRSWLLLFSCARGFHFFPRPCPCGGKKRWIDCGGGFHPPGGDGGDERIWSLCHDGLSKGNWMLAGESSGIGRRQGVVVGPTVGGFGQFLDWMGMWGCRKGIFFSLGLRSDAGEIGTCGWIYLGIRVSAIIVLVLRGLVGSVIWV